MSNDKGVRCPVCEAVLEDVSEEDNKLALQCASCGRFSVGLQVYGALLKGAYADQLNVLSGILRDRSDKNSPLELLSNNIAQLISDADLPETQSEYMTLILRFAIRQSKFRGDRIAIKPDDYPVAFAKNSEEFMFFLRGLVKEGYLEDQGMGHGYVVTSEGWESVDAIMQPSSDSRQVFVAMWFDPETEDAWNEGIMPAVRSYGFEPVRIDKRDFNEKICSEILIQVEKSRFLIADFTGSRGGVYFEAGYALGFGLEVIWSCQENDFDGLSFNTRQYNHIKWNKPIDLRESLLKRIDATIA